MKGEMNMIIL